MSQAIVEQLVIPFVVRFFLVFGIVGFAVGVGLAMNQARMVQLFGVMNRWISLRRSTRWLSVPRDSGPVIQRFRYPIGVTFIFVAGFSMYVLVTQVDAIKVIEALNLGISIAAGVWIMDSLRWFLVAGCAVAIAVGMLLVFFPNTLRAIETYANHWYSARTHNRGADTMHMMFDEWIARHPRATGWTIAAASLIVVIDFAVLIITRNF